MTTICLNMIVKNESHIILETLENLCEKIKFDYWVISDTGSEDNTVELISEFFEKKKIQGEIHHHFWKNFSHNRNLALEACKGKSDYVFFFDADDLIDGKIEIPSQLIHDAYYFQMTSENRITRYKRKLLIKNNGNFYWRGVVHEFIDEREKISIGSIDGDYLVISRRKGSRSKVSDEEKYLRDAQLLSTAFFENEDPDLLPRYAFYAAQSFQDAELPEQAEEWYLRRVNIKEGWIEERYIAYLRLGFIAENKNNYEKAIEYWNLAISIVPERAEAWYYLAKRYRKDKNFTLAYAFASQGSKKELPKGSRLFLQQDIYQYWLIYETCISSYQYGNYSHSYECFKQLLNKAPVELIKQLVYQLDKYIIFIHKEERETMEEIRNVLVKRELSDIANKYFSKYYETNKQTNKH